ncbi:MAG: hypothetical protein K0S16_1651, partial [Moraxellaceae bacterium]|nr:hypothetical protein [Moraxellaceae bacterium]
PMPDTQLARIQCPYCWEQIDVVVDCSVAEQEYIEDCSVCCRPITITVAIAGDEIASIAARSENE